MKIVSYTDEDFRPFEPRLRQACRKFGHEPAVYHEEDFDPEVLDIPHDCAGPRITLGKAPYKPIVIKRAMEEFDEAIVWMDADAFPIRPLDMDWDFDVAFTLRPASERGGFWRVWDGLINSGVSFCGNTPSAKSFVEEWMDAVPGTRTRSDQEAVNVCLLNRGWNADYGDHDLEGLRVRILSTEEWNCYQLPPPPEARILHFKGSVRDRYDEYFALHHGPASR